MGPLKMQEKVNKTKKAANVVQIPGYNICLSEDVLLMFLNLKAFWYNIHICLHINTLSVSKI